MSSTRLAELNSDDDVTVAQGVVLLRTDPTNERRTDQALWLLNHLHTPIRIQEIDKLYTVVDIFTNTNTNSGSASGSGNFGGNLGANGNSSRHLYPQTSPGNRTLTCWRDRYESGGLLDSSQLNMLLFTETLDRQFKFTEETTFWSMSEDCNVVFVIDISQSMYSLDPNTNEAHIHTALETMEKCIMGIVQPIIIRSSLGLPDILIEPHICASVVAYCPRPQGSYPVERDRKKLPFCRTLAHACQVTMNDLPDFMKVIRNFLFNYESEIQDSLGSFPPPPPPIPIDPVDVQEALSAEKARKSDSKRSAKSSSKSKKQPKPGDTYTFAYDPDAPLLHTLQIADYFLRILPEVCASSFVFLTDGVLRSNFATSKAQSLISSLGRRNTKCTFVQVGSCGGFTPETTLGFVGDNELLLYLAASLDGTFIYASDFPDTVSPNEFNFYHHVIIAHQTRLAGTPVRHRYDVVRQGARRLGDMPRERLDNKKTGSLQTMQGGDPGFPWCAECKPPIVDTATTCYGDYSIPVSMGVLIDSRLNEGFVVKNIHIAKLDREGLTERVKVKLELVWHANITIVYRIINTYYMGQSDMREGQSLLDDGSNNNSNSSSVSGSANRSPASSVSLGEVDPKIKDRSQRSHNMVDIVVRSYNMFTFAFMQFRPGDASKGEVFAKADMLHQFLKSIKEKDERLRQLYQIPAKAPSNRARTHPRIFVPQDTETLKNPHPIVYNTLPLATRIQPDEIDPKNYIDCSLWTPQHWLLYDKIQQFAKSGDILKTLACFKHTTSVFIDSELILSYMDGMDFTEAAKHGNLIMNDLRAYVCQHGTWAMMKDENTSVVFLRDHLRLSNQIPAFVITRWSMATNWVMRISFSLYNGTLAARDLVSYSMPFFCDRYRPTYRDPSRESVVRATRPLHLLPMDLDSDSKMPRNLLSTRDMGDLHTYVVEWRWTYLAREGTREDLSGEGSDSEIVRQALHRLALTLGFHRLTQDFTLINAKGESTGLTSAPDALKYDSCLTFYHEREGYDREELLLACQYQIIVDMKQSTVAARTWIEPWSARFIRSLFEDDFRILAPLGTFQQILQPARCFQLKVPNLAEFHNKRMNMFSIMAVVNSSRIALRLVQLPEISPAFAVWNQPDGADSVKLDDPTFQITPEPDIDEDLEIQEFDENGKIFRRTKATEYYKTHDREETRRLASEKKLRIMHMGTSYGERRAILLERFMLTLFDKSEEGRYDPYIEKYRLNEYNPFILALINPGHPRKLFFNKLAAEWMTTGEFTMVAYRCFLEFALFKHCDAISVNAERFNKLRFASSIVSELTAHSPGVHQATGVPNALDEHLYMDKWFVIRLPNNSSFLMVILPNVPLSAPRRDRGGQGCVFEVGSGGESTSRDGAETGATTDATAGTHRRTGSQPASPPVFTPALESSITGAESSAGSGMTAINAYTLVMECSMDNGEMHRHVRSMDIHAAATKTQLNLRPLEVGAADTRVPGDLFQGFVGQKDVPIPFTEYAIAEIRRLERMYAEAHLQTMYLALLLKRQVAAADLAFSQQSSLWRRRSIDVDITAFLHSQDAARLSREPTWQAQDRQSLQERFAGLLSESFTALPGDATQGRLYYCRPMPDRRSELELCLQLAQNPLFINLQCSVEVLDGASGHNQRLNMPIDQLPLSLERLCEQAGLQWRPPTDHFETSMDVRVILHINCMYLPEESVARSVDDVDPLVETKMLEPKPDKHVIDGRATRAFQKTMSLSSLVRGGMSSLTPSDIISEGDVDALPSAVIAKKHTNAQIATLEGLPHDQLELVRHCHRRLVRFVAQETLYALRDIHLVTGPLLRQVWHTTATTVDEDVPSDRFEFAHNKIDLHFLINNPDQARRRHAMDLVMAELLKPHSMPPGFPLGKLQQLDGIVYMRDVRSRSDRIEARARMRARALSDSNDADVDAAAATVSSVAMVASETAQLQTADLADAIPSWFLIKPTAALDGVRILTHNYSAVTNEAADNVLAATRQLLMVALKAANTRLLLEEMAETRRFPDQLLLPDAARANKVASGTRLGQHNNFMDVHQPMREETAPGISSSPSAMTLGGQDRSRKTGTLSQAHTTGLYSNPSEPDFSSAAGNPFSIASVLKPYIPDSPEFYACDLQFSSMFPLHPRISPQKAIQAVLASGMMNSRLTNHRNMFFVRDGSSLFYAVLSIGRKPYINPFTNPPPAPSAMPATSSSGLPVPAIAGAWAGRQAQSTVPSPQCTVEHVASGAHTVATTSPDPSGYMPHADSLSLMQQTASSIARRRSPLAPPMATTSALTLSALAGSDGMGPVGIDLKQSGSPRLTAIRAESPFKAGFGGDVRQVVDDASARNTNISSTPESPSTRYFVSSLTNVDGQQQQQRQQHLASPGGLVSSEAAGGAGRYQLTHTNSIVSLPTFETQPPADATPSVIGPVEEKFVPCILLYVYGVDKPSKELTRGLMQQIDECITVHVTMPEMSGMLLRQVALNDYDMNFLFPKCNPEPTFVYLPLPRFVHDLDCLLRHFKQTMGDIVPQFPSSNLVAKAMRRSFVHLRNRSSDHGSSDTDDKGAELSIGTRVPNALRKDLSRILAGWEFDSQTPRRLPVERMVFLYNFFAHAGGAPPPIDKADIGPGIAIVSAFPLSSERVVAKSIWTHPLKRDPPNATTSVSALASGSGHRFDIPGSSNNADSLGISPSIGGHGGKASSQHRRVASCANPDAMPPENPAGSGVAGVEGLAEAGPSMPDQRPNYFLHRRVSHTPSLHERGDQTHHPSQPQQPQAQPQRHHNHQSPSSPVASTPSTGFSLAPDAGSAFDDGATGPRRVPVSQMASLFGEFLRQFKSARSLMRFAPADFEDLTKIMENQIDEFAGQPVMAIALWSNTSVRVDRLAAFVSRAYWNALGDYVSEQVLYPILSAGWGNRVNSTIRLPDPYTDLELCSKYPNEPDSRISFPADVEVRLDTEWGDNASLSQMHQALLNARDMYLPRAPSTFTESTKKQVHAMEIARKMAQYWGNQETVRSLRHHRQKLPRVTGISHYFSEELRGVLETICPAMKPTLFRLLENPLVLNESNDSSGKEAPTSLFPAYSLRKPTERKQTSVVYDVSALPKALKGTRQSFCIMCTLPLETSASTASTGQQAPPSHYAAMGTHGHSSAAAAAAASGTVSSVHSRRLETLKKAMAGVDSSGNAYSQRHSSRSSASSGLNPAVQGQVHGLGLQGWLPGDQLQQQQQHQHHQQRHHHYFGPHANRLSHYSAGGIPGASKVTAAADVHRHLRRSHGPSIANERSSTSSAAKKKPPISDYKPIADPETPVLSVEEITHYSIRDNLSRASTKAWLTVWLIGGELEMVGYNVSEHMWECICDQIRQRLERESRRKQLLAMFAAHMCGVFPGFEQQTQQKGISSTWLDRDVTRDLINKFALLKQVEFDDQIHYFNIERILSPDYMRLLSLHEGSEELARLIANPPVQGMTLNDTKTELALRQLQPEHLRWARKLTFVDYTQPYVDTNHPDTLFRVGTRFLRSYQNKIGQVLRYDELMKIAERWRQLIAMNGLHSSLNQTSRIVMLDLQTNDTQTSSAAGEGRAALYSASASGSRARADQSIQAPPRGDSQEASADSSPAAMTKAAGKMPANAKPHAAERAAKEGYADSSRTDEESEMSLEDIQMIMENARLLHFVCAPLPVTSSIKPAGTDARAFKRLFRVVSAFLQNLADSYVDYLCSTGYIVARRFEKQLSWRESLQSLGYSAEKVTQFTNTVLGQPRPFFGHQKSTAEAALPGIQIPSAYLFGSTERTNLVTDIEVSPEMLSIRMHALSRFTSEWRSAVPGYLRSSVNPQSIKKFTFDISRYKKLLHIKSFVYDFQLRYVANLLKPANGTHPTPADESQHPGHVDSQLHDCRDHAIYSSDSDTDSLGEASSNGHSSGDSADDEDGQVWIPGEHEDANGYGADPHSTGPSCRNQRCGQRTVAEALHVHIDLTVFLADLSEQRYFSTRFSSRRLVRARFPTMYREMYEYFLAHSKRYQFYTDGCRPPMGENVSGVPSPSSRSVPVADLCSSKASHSGCYRLYEGVLPDTMHMQLASVFGNSEPQSDVGSYPWMPATIEASPQQKHDIAGIAGRSIGGGRHRLTAGEANKAHIASSAPETLHKSPSSKNGSLETMQKLRVNPLAFNSRGRGAHLYPGSEGLAPPHPQQPLSGGSASGGGAYAGESRQLAMSYAPGTQLGDAFKSRIGQNLRGGDIPPFAHRSHANRHQSPPRSTAFQVAALTRSDQFSHAGALNVSLSSSPRMASSLGSHASRAPTAAYEHADRPGHAGSAMAEALSAADRSLDFAINEYAANRIHLTSNGSFVRVSLMALTPDCETCRMEHSKEEHSSRERQRNLSQYIQEQRQGMENAAEGDYAESSARKRHKEHHRRHRKRHGHKKKDGSPKIIDDFSELFGRSKTKSGFSNSAHSRACPMYHSVQTASATADNVSLGGGKSRSQHQQPLKSPGDEGYSRGKDLSPLQRWMASLASDIITDPFSDGLGGNALPFSTPPTAHNSNGNSCNTSQLSYYLIIDMDPQTTHALSNLKAEDARSRNGSLGPVLDCADNSGDSSSTKGAIALGMRPCKGCQVLSQCAGRPKTCGLHKVLGAVHVDMRDWENKGDVWANEPTMVMESSAIDPDEYDKEDPDVLAWIRKTARRMIRHTVVDYHRDFNWYRTYQHLRMADLPSGLVPGDISDLVGFIERQGWIDIGTVDSASQQLISLGISGQRVIETLQLRLRKLYLEPAQLMASLLAGQANIASRSEAVPQFVSDESGLHPDTGHRRQTITSSAAAISQQQQPGDAVRHNALSSPSLNAFVSEIPPSLDVPPVALSRHPSANPGSDIFASDEAAACVYPAARDSLCPVAVIDVHGRVLSDRSSTNIHDLLRLLSPLSTRPSRRILLDPTFQKMLSRYIRLDIDACPWLCGEHRQTYTTVGFDWHLDDNQGLNPNAAGALSFETGPGAAIPRGFAVPTIFASEESIAKSTNRRVQQVQEIDIGGSVSGSTRHRGQRRRTGNSAISLGITEQISSSLNPGQALTTSAGASDTTSSAHNNATYVNGHRRLESHSGCTSRSNAGSSAAGPFGNDNNTTASPRHANTMSSESPATATFHDRFSRPCVEAMPGSLLIVDPSDTEHAARMVVLNPFAYHSFIELMFSRSIEGGEVRLCQIRSIARDRQRDGLYEYERKHINMVLSTISAVIWDIMTASTDSSV